MNVLEVFAGRGGWSHGLEKAGHKTVAFCENDPYCQKILNIDFKGVPVFREIKKLKAHECDMGEIRVIEDGQAIDKGFTVGTNIGIIAGSHPCTGHSVAGKKEGFKNEASNLWREQLRLTREIRPKYCLVENSPNLRNTGLVEMLKAYDEIGYNAEFSILSAYSVGSPHQRERIYIVFWRKDLPYPNPFRSWMPDLEKEKAQSDWWSMRRIKRSPLFKQITKIKHKVLQLDDGVSRELITQIEDQIKINGNGLMPQIVYEIGRQLT